MPLGFACRLTALLIFCVYLSSPVVSAQQTVPQEYRNERILVIVPMIGTGKADDPIRPMFAPIPPLPVLPSQSPKAVQETAPQQPQFLSMTYEISDDGKTALVEFVAKSRDSFKEILASKLAEVKVFERGKNSAADVEREFQKVKPTYKFDKDAAVKATSTNGTTKTGVAQ